MKKMIKNGTIVTATDTFSADVLIDNGKVTAIGFDLPSAGMEVIDAKGCYLFPGGIDPHTHLEMPFGGTVSKDDFESGTIDHSATSPQSNGHYSRLGGAIAR